ncbi:MAG: hydrogenase expression/formation protein HypE [Gaiellaceae bacterium]
MSERAPRRKPKLRDERITLVHGAGGKATRDLVEALFVEELGNPLLEPLGDSALIEAEGTRLAFTTDAHVVQPLFYPGGDIGSLAVNGTVNDIAVSGARPLALSAAFVLEEGLPVADLRRVVASMAEAAREAGVVVAAGDTKVVERGRGDGMTVTTAAIGLVDERVSLGAERVRPGDKVIVSGTLGDHGMAVMIARGNLELEVEIESDSASIYPLAESLFALRGNLRWLRDPTRGGLATTLNELTEACGLCVVLDEKTLPVREQVAAACEILGLDPLYVANEGKLIAVVAPARAEEALALLRAHPLGAEAQIVGEIEPEPQGLVLLQTSFGGSRVVDMPAGDPLPRIC